MGSSYRAAGAFRKRGVISRLSDLIWPPRSLLSEAIVDRPGVIEAELWGELTFLGRPAVRLLRLAAPGRRQSWRRVWRLCGVEASLRYRAGGAGL
jgi:hypothetical protein